jgi:hypothetical protein
MEMEESRIGIPLAERTRMILLFCRGTRGIRLLRGPGPVCKIIMKDLPCNS